MALVTAPLGACVLLCLGLFAPAAQASAVDDGSAAFDAGRFTDALRLWSGAARDGDAQAAFDIGLLYDLGEGVPESASRAFHWYELAAEAGLETGQFNLGVMYDSGRGVPRDIAKAAIYYARAAAQGHARAAFNLGQLYAQGEGVPKDPNIARAWYAVASKDIPFSARRATVAGAAQPTDSGPLAAPVLSWPQAATRVQLLIQHPVTEFVWTPARDDRPVHFFLEVRILENGRYDEVYAGYVDTTAVAVSLIDDKDYAWRVYAVTKNGSAYAPSPWSHFETSRRVWPEADYSGSPGF